MTSMPAVVPAVLELRGASVTFPGANGGVVALAPTDLAIQDRDAVAVVGRSGSGKSSLVSVMALMRSPSTGEVRVDGARASADVESMRRAREGTVSMVFQSFHLEPHLTAAENIMLSWHTTASGLRRGAARARALELSELVGLEALADRRVSNMSGGERQRVAIARALFPAPRVLIADEPTGNLDEDNAAHISQLLWSLPDELGSAVVIVTHDPTVAGGARRRISLKHGYVMPDSPTEEVVA